MNTNYNSEMAADAAAGPCNRKNEVNGVNNHGRCGSPSRSHGEPRPNKTSVRFNPKSILYHLDTPKASDMSPEEKETAWYTSDEYDRLKHEVAKNAGVKVINVDQGHRFVMVGDFDCKDEKKCASGASAKNNGICADTSATPRENATRKFCYNENEYDDSVDENGESVCKRGLGYHFSRGRRASKVHTRSTIVAWQKLLRDRYGRSSQAFRQGPPRVRSDLGRVDESQSMLALISAKCSRVAREEARWRGDVDYQVAYPERHESLAAPPPHPRNKKSNAARGDSSTTAKGKRVHDEPDNASHVDNASRKRQRTSSPRCGINGGGLSRIAILSRVLRAEV